MIYLDSAATTPMYPSVLNEMLPFLGTKYGNPNSIHGMGLTTRKAVDKARHQVAGAINANPENIIFTSGGSEANNLVIQGIKKAHRDIAFFSSKMEHTSSLKALEYVNAEGSKVQYTNEFNASNCTYTHQSLVWMMYVNNEVGKINPVYEIGGECVGNNDLYFGTDCVQALGFERIDVMEMQCDFLTMSAHKIHGPKGVGALYVKDPDLIKPLIYGGVSQEFGLRGGTENVAGIVGFGVACQLAEQHRESNRATILELRNLFLENLDGLNYKLNCANESKMLSLQFLGVDAETLVLALSSQGIAISSGSACRNKESQANEALLSYGLKQSEAMNTVRISFMEINTKEEIITAAQQLKKTVHMLL